MSEERKQLDLHAMNRGENPSDAHTQIKIKKIKNHKCTRVKKRRRRSRQRERGAGERSGKARAGLLSHATGMTKHAKQKKSSVHNDSPPAAAEDDDEGDEEAGVRGGCGGEEAGG